jgi:hypothetical protein
MTKPLIHLSTGLQLQHAEERREYRCTFVTAGRIRRADNSPGPFTIPAEAIRDALSANRFTGKATFVDHADWFEGPSLRNLAGITLYADWDEATQAAAGLIRLYENPAGDIVASLFDQVLADAQDGEPVPDVGLSLVFYPRWKPRDNPDQELELAEFRHVESVDFVFQPAAEGRVHEALVALSTLNTDHYPLNTEPTERSSPTMSENTTATHDSTSVVVEPQSPPETPALPENALDGQLWLDSFAQSAAEAMINASGLPALAQERLRSQPFGRPDEVRDAITREQEYLAALNQHHVVQVGDTPPRGARITLGPSSLEQVEMALEALLSGTRPEQGVRPLTGIREFYTLMSGDYEMTGRFHPDRITLANVTSSTMAGLVANALNKRVINLFQSYPQWWGPIVVEEDFTSLQQVKWISLGGVGELPTVAEGAAYTELTWDDQTETADFVKKGGYLGITLEAMDKDDTRRLRAAPRALAQGAWLTLSKLVSAIFTDNSGTGPVMSDSNNLFDASNHSNLLTTGLSYAQWGVVRTAMMKQTEIHSGERLGFMTAPKYCLVPIDLEATALELFASESEPGQANKDENVYAIGNQHSSRMQSARSRVIVIPLWTDVNNWAAVADPNLYPSIAIGYRYGRQPEIFSVASPTAGLMFTNDTMPVKVRFFVAVGPTDWRGLHKSNVA